MAKIAAEIPITLAGDEGELGLDRLVVGDVVGLPPSQLAVRIGDLVTWSGGLYDPPSRFRDW